MRQTSGAISVTGVMIISSWNVGIPVGYKPSSGLIFPTQL